MRTTNLKPFKRHKYDNDLYINPLSYDITSMASDIGHNITVLYMSHEHNNHIIIVDNVTGERLLIDNFAKSEIITVFNEQKKITYENASDS